MLTSIRRLSSAGLAIMLGVGFVAATLMLTTSLDATLRTAAAGAIRDAQVVVTRDPVAPEPQLTEEYVAALRGLPGVTGVRPTVETSAMNIEGNQAQVFKLQTVPELTERTRLVAGRLPDAPGEALVNEVAAKLRSWQPGDTLTLEYSEPRSFTIVGILEAGTDTTTDTTVPHAFLQLPDITTQSGRTVYTEVYVTGAGSTGDLVDALRALPQTDAAGAAVLTAEEAAQQRIRDFTRGSEQLAVMLLAFAAVAVVVAGLVVANTFAILVAQRTRQLALLRTVGATRGQVFRTVLAEAAILGAVAGVLGVGLGAGAVAAVAPFTQDNPLMRIDGLAATPRDLLLPLALGVALAVVAAIVPARHATRVPPLAALRPQVATAVDRRARQGRPVVAASMTVLGFALLAVAALVMPRLFESPGLGVLVGIAGGLLSVAGVLLLGRRLIPALARALATGLRRIGGVPAELAAENAVRNPGRAAATTGALLVGVTLVTMMTVGAASGQASILRDIDSRYPVDAVASSWEEFTQAQIEVARSLPKVAAATQILNGGAVDADGRWFSLIGFAPDAAPVLRDPTVLDGLADGVLLVGPDAKLADGSSLTLQTGDRRESFTVRVNPRAGELVAMTTATLEGFLPETQRTLGLRFVDGVSAVEASDEVGRTLGAAGPGVNVISAAQQRAVVLETVDTVLLVVLGLLAVAVVIAVVGVGNTVGLSVHERLQESGLLRAMGLTRGQLRASLGWEAFLLAAVAVVLGLSLGVVYGLAGVSALISSDAPVVGALPWARLGLIVAAALLAGWAASVLPAIRASRVPPAAALAWGD